MKENYAHALLDLRRHVDATILLVAFVDGYFLSGQNLAHPWVIGLTWLTIKLVCLHLSGTYNRFWRFTSLKDMRETSLFVAASDMATIPLLLWAGLPFTDTLFMSMCAFMGLGLARLWKRVSFEHHIEQEIRRHGKPTLIYGVTDATPLLIKRAQHDPDFGLWPVAVLDATPQGQGKVIEGVPVCGHTGQLEDVCQRHKVQEIIIAQAKLDGDELAHVLAIARKLHIRPRMLSGQGLDSFEAKKYEIFKDVNINDLLARDKVVVEPGPIRESVHDRHILVTGAGGSIGSELCRQLMAMGPTRLILADHSEFNLYMIHKELQERWPSTQTLIDPVLLDVKDRDKLDTLFSQQPIDLVYHAAAYKHVHLVEMNPHSAILNNVGGTRNVIDACVRHNVERFVLVSSDKAVNPTSVMGATKRICELLTTMAALHTDRSFCSVRFGNVLGSSGSFIPLLKQQIRNGGPVTITDPRMQRYFMTIPEAVSLVLEASRMSKPGDINVLKMGEPLMIVDVAKKMIALMGKTEEEIPIIFTGIRPGEKLYEELYLCGDEVQTHHRDIVVLPRGDAFGAATGLKLLRSRIDLLCELAGANESRAVRLLHQLVQEHKRSRPEDNKAEVTAA